MPPEHMLKKADDSDPWLLLLAEDNAHDLLCIKM